ncbi:MAG: zinc-ribbon domain-containing protein [Clostridiaceae bacterium]|nr:zinc-ribbon domain-containing protein [Clostridiaceae bacterium]
MKRLQNHIINNDYEEKGGRILYCSHCGKQISDESKFCSYCGRNIREDEVNEIMNTFEIETPNNENVSASEDRSLKKRRSWIWIGIVAVLIAGIITTIKLSDYLTSQNLEEVIIGEWVFQEDDFSFYFQFNVDGTYTNSIMVSNSLPQVQVGNYYINANLLNFDGNEFTVKLKGKNTMVWDSEILTTKKLHRIATEEFIKSVQNPGMVSHNPSYSSGADIVATQNNNKELFPIELNDKWGYIDETGKVVISPKYDTYHSYDLSVDGTNPFYDGLARVVVNGKFGFINKSGQYVIQPKYEFAKDFSENLAAVKVTGEGWKYINRSGEYAFEPNFRMGGAQSFFDGMAAVNAGGKWGYINKEGNFVIKPQYVDLREEDLSLVGDFSEGLAAVKLEKVGYIDTKGSCVIEPQFDETRDFSDGFAAVCIGDKWGFIDKHGNYLTELKFDWALSFSEGLAAVTIGDKRGFINKEGNLVIELQFDGGRSWEKGFSEGLAVVELGDKYGYIDKNGNLVIPAIYDSCGDFKNGLAMVRCWMDESYFGYIDQTGNFIYRSDG